MPMSVNGLSPVGFSSPPPQQDDAALFQQMLGQLADGYGLAPQDLFNLIKSYMSPPAAGGASGVPGPVASGGANDGELQKVLGQFAANTLQSGQGMLQQAMEKFFAEDEEPDEDDPDAEPL